MANIKNGEVSWTDTVFDSSKKTNSKDTFLRLNPGSNVIRLLTLPHQYHQHKYLPQGGKKFGYRVNCSAANGGCALCEKGDKAKRRWFLGVVDRKTNMYKILDIGFSVFKSIQTYAKDEAWGDPSKYDFDIVVDPNGGATGYYTVVAKPPKALTASDIVLREENDPEELARRVTPPTPEKTQERLAMIAEEISAMGGGSSHDSMESKSSSSDDEEDDNYFKKYDGEKKPPF